MINVELSNIWSCVSLPDLLSREKELFDAHLHLRSNKPGFPQYLGWLGQPDSLTARSLHAIRSAADAVRANADTLVVLGSCSAAQAAKAGGLEFDVPFNRQQMADYLNLDRSALSKELCKMRDEGLLEFEKNRFCLKEDLE